MSEIDKPNERSVPPTSTDLFSMLEKEVDVSFEPTSDVLAWLSAHRKSFDTSTLEQLVTLLNQLCSVQSALLQGNSPGVRRGALERTAREASRLLLWVASMHSLKGLEDLKSRTSPTKNGENFVQLLSSIETAPATSLKQ